MFARARPLIAAVERSIGTAPDRVVMQPPRTIPITGNGKIRHGVVEFCAVSAPAEDRDDACADQSASHGVRLTASPPAASSKPASEMPRPACQPGGT